MFEKVIEILKKNNGKEFNPSQKEIIKKNINFNNISSFYSLLKKKYTTSHILKAYKITNFLMKNSSFSQKEKFFTNLIVFIKEQKNFTFLLKTYLEFSEFLVNMNHLEQAESILLQSLNCCEKIEITRDNYIDIFYILSIINFSKLINELNKEDNANQNNHNLITHFSNYLEINKDALNNIIKNNFAKDKRKVIESKILTVILLTNLKVEDTIETQIKDIQKMSQDSKSHSLKGLYHFILGKSSEYSLNYVDAYRQYYFSMDAFSRDNNYSDNLLVLLALANLLFLDKQYDKTKSIIKKLSKNKQKFNKRIYLKTLYYKFCLEKNEIKLLDKILRNLEKFPRDSLSSEEKYNIYLFAADYYSNDEIKFDNATKYYELANLNLRENWILTVNIISEIENYISQADYNKLSKSIVKKLEEFVMEETIHFNHFSNSLKIAYTEISHMNQRLKEISEMDFLTNLHNRRYFWENSKKMLLLADREKKPISIVIFDIDDFKRINDTYGHSVGDVVLKEIAQIIKSNFRESDLIIRFGGEEFLAMLFNSTSNNTKLISEFILEKISRESIEIAPNKYITLTVSAGVYGTYELFPRNHEFLNHMIEKADKALYYSKSHGKNMVAAFNLIKNEL